MVHSSYPQPGRQGRMLKMSELLRGLASYIRNSTNPDMHVISGQDWSEEEGYSAGTEPQQGRAELVDPKGNVDGVSVGDPQAGRLKYFMDGIERKHVPLYFSMVPIVYGYIAAVIRERGEDKRMCTFAEGHAFSEALFFPFRMVEPSGFMLAGLKTVNTENDEKPLEEHPMILREAARVAISNARGRLETELAKIWLEKMEGGQDWLVVDGSLGGTLGGDYRRYESPNVLGVIKSHQTQYFSMEEQRKILSLRAGERSGIFKPLGREHQAPVYSWYLRLRPCEGQDVYFGLVRIEAPANDRTIEMVDELSRWLLAERCPLSLPDSRWDRMFYPIRDCEQYLRSLAPTKTMLEASMIGLGA